MVVYLLDTNIISETTKVMPNPKVAEWLHDTSAHKQHISVLTLGEVRKGIEQLPSGPQRVKLARWLEEELEDWFGTRVLEVDREVADTWGHLMAQAGRTLPTMDSLLAATAVTHGLVMVTRNLRHFRIPGLKVFNPWEA